MPKPSMFAYVNKYPFHMSWLASTVKLQKIETPEELVVEQCYNTALSSPPFLMIPSFRTDRSGQTVQTQIRLLLEEKSDQGLHRLQFWLHLLGALLFGNAILFKF